MGPLIAGADSSTNVRIAAAPNLLKMNSRRNARFRNASQALTIL